MLNDKISDFQSQKNYLVNRILYVTVSLTNNS